MKTIGRLARDYFREVIRGGVADSGAFDRFLTLMKGEPAAAWDIVLKLVEQSTSDIDLAHVGAGPLEDILVAHPKPYVAKAVAEAERDPKMRKALVSVVIAKDELPASYRSLLNSAREEF